MQAIGGLLLVVGVLRRQAENLGDAERLELGEMIAKAARLRRAAARAGDLIPARRRIDARHAGARIDVNHRAALELRQVHHAAAGRRQRDVRQLHAGQMPRPAVVLRRGNIGRQEVRIVRAGRFSHFSLPRTT